MQKKKKVNKHARYKQEFFFFYLTFSATKVQRTYSFLSTVTVTVVRFLSLTSSSRAAFKNFLAFFFGNKKQKTQTYHRKTERSRDNLSICLARKDDESHKTLNAHIAIVFKVKEEKKRSDRKRKKLYDECFSLQAWKKIKIVTLGTCLRVVCTCANTPYLFKIIYQVNSRITARVKYIIEDVNDANEKHTGLFGVW